MCVAILQKKASNTVTLQLSGNVLLALPFSNCHRLRMISNGFAVCSFNLNKKGEAIGLGD